MQQGVTDEEANVSAAAGLGSTATAEGDFNDSSPDTVERSGGFSTRACLAF